MSDAPPDDTPPEGEPEPIEPTPEVTPKGPLPDDPAALKAELDKVRKEAAKYRTEARDLRPLADKARQIEEADKTEAQKLADANAAEKTRADNAERELLRYKVAAVKQVPASLIDRLKGETEEEMAEDADLLLKDMNRAPGSADSGPRDRDDKPKRSTSLEAAVSKAMQTQTGG